MVLELGRKRFAEALKPFVKRVPLKPNTLSILAFLLTVGSAVCLLFAPSSNDVLILAGAVLISISGFLDALDGEVARAKGLASKKGDFTDHVLDRYADVVILMGMLLLVEPLYLLFAIEGVLLTSYMGTQAQALGLGRLYSGIMGRADRLVIIILILIFEFVFLPGYRILKWGVIAIAILSNGTAIERAIVVYKKLED